VLLFTIPGTSEDVAAEFETLLKELTSFNPGLERKPRVVVLSKMDLIAPDERDERIESVRVSLPEKVPVFPVSAVVRIGLEQLIHGLWEKIGEVRRFD